MAPFQSLFFGPYRLERHSGSLWRGEQRIALQPRTFALLQYLAERPGELLSAQELRDQAWQNDPVSIGAFRVSIHELRQALEDDAAAPRYIEILQGQGYRFCARVTTPEGVLLQRASTVIGRTYEVGQLQARLAKAQRGQRQLVFVSGEVGMGKTTLVEAFVSSLAEDHGIGMGRGYCIEHTGSVEAYLPVLDALGNLGRSHFGRQLMRVLQQVAPTWLLQLPMLLFEAENEGLHVEAATSTRARMVRELVDALGILSRERLVVLVLEDLHWSDPSTIHLLSAIMGQVDPARLLILGTFRPLEAQVHDHPLLGLLRERQGHERGLVLSLTPLSLDAIRTFLVQRLSGAIDVNLAAFLYKRSDGNPLFLCRLAEYLIDQGLLIKIHGAWQLRDEALADKALPNGVRQLLSKQIDQLPEMVQAVLKAASTAGMQFTTAMVASGAEAEADMIDETLIWAASRSYFVQTGVVEVWPDGTISSGYRFGHALYRQVLYERLSAEQRVKWHRQIGERLERAYLDDLEPVVGLLAYHFVQGYDVPRALQYLHRASVKALGRFAAHEAIAHLRSALERLPTLSPEHDRVQIEYDLQSTLGTAIVAAKGVRVPEACTAFQRAYQLGVAMGDIDRLFPPLVGMEMTACGEAQYVHSQHLAGQLLNYAQISQDPLHMAYAYSSLSINHMLQGHYMIAHVYAQACQRLPLPPDRLRHHPAYTINPILFCQRWHAILLVELGYPAQALALSRALLARVREVGDPSITPQGLLAVASVSIHCLPPTTVFEVAQELLAHAQQYGQLIWEQLGKMLVLRACAHLGMAPVDGLAQLETILDTFGGIGVRQGTSLMMFAAADICERTGHIEAGLALLRRAQAFIEETGERIFETELYRHRGKLLQRQGDFDQAEACLSRALALAHQKGAKGAALRAATLLGRQWQEQGEPERARDLLQPIYNRFTEGFDTLELQAAKALLDDLRLNSPRAPL